MPVVDHVGRNKRVSRKRVRPKPFQVSDVSAELWMITKRLEAEKWKVFAGVIAGLAGKIAFRRVLIRDWIVLGERVPACVLSLESLCDTRGIDQ